MCGIAGIYRRRNLDDSDPLRLQAMSDAIVHRGPDDFGYLLLDSHNGKFQTGQTGFQWQPCDVFLGNRRLSIIDFSPNGRQPIRNEASDTFAIFNGEIFNYLELRNLLEAKGHIFRSQTDSEVIIHAYEQWGTDCVKRFNGMWALAIWDQRKRELFCSRDRFGIKPFYYYLDASAFLFASEIKSILAHPQVSTRPNDDMLAAFLVGNRAQDRHGAAWLSGAQRWPFDDAGLHCGEGRLDRATSARLRPRVRPGQRNIECDLRGR